MGRVGGVNMAARSTRRVGDSARRVSGGHVPGAAVESRRYRSLHQFKLARRALGSKKYAGSKGFECSRRRRENAPRKP